jgi:hypothetical protein
VDDLFIGPQPNWPATLMNEAAVAKSLPDDSALAQNGFVLPVHSGMHPPFTFAESIFT